jgi:hypothetical protein
MTITGADVDDAFFERLREHFSDDQLVELTAAIAWENSSSKFNRALRVPSQGLWEQQRQRQAQAQAEVTTDQEGTPRA